MSEENINKKRDEKVKNIQTTSEAIHEHTIEKSKMHYSQISKNIEKPSTCRIYQKNITTKTLDKNKFKPYKDKLGLDMWITKSKPKVNKLDSRNENERNGKNKIQRKIDKI